MRMMPAEPQIPLALFKARGILSTAKTEKAMVDDSQAEWKPVVGFEGWYEVSSSGHVKRSRPGNGTSAGRILKPFTWSRGYQGVRLSRGTPESRTQALLQKVVAEAFIGPRSPGLTINHKDGNKRNNHAENLEYMSGWDNLEHAYRTGLAGRRKLLSLEQRGVIIRLGESVPDVVLARQFGVNRKTIWRIKHMARKRGASKTP
jgi:hypothetical protein